MTEISDDEVLSDSHIVVSELGLDKEKPFGVTYQTRQKVFFASGTNMISLYLQRHLECRVTLSRFYLSFQGYKTTNLTVATDQTLACAISD